MFERLRLVWLGNQTTESEKLCCLLTRVRDGLNSLSVFTRRSKSGKVRVPEMRSQDREGYAVPSPQCGMNGAITHERALQAPRRAFDRSQDRRRPAAIGASGQREDEAVPGEPAPPGGSVDFKRPGSIIFWQKISILAP